MTKAGNVRLSRAFCSARDRNVPVLSRRNTRARAGDASRGVPDLVSCLDYGVRCTGWLCPLFEVPTLPPEELLAEAAAAERTRRHRDISDGRAILERARRERVSHESGADPPPAS